MSNHRYVWLPLLLANAPAHSASLSAQHCADAAAHQAAIRRIVVDMPALGLSAAQRKQALDSLDEEWKRAFGATVAQPRYQEAVEDYASRVRDLLSVAQHPNKHSAVTDSLALARHEEDLAYARLQEQARLACPAPPS